MRRLVSQAWLILVYWYNNTGFKKITFSDILKIDNLWFFTNLVKLNLDNNIIEKIQNLDSLIHLEWLGEPIYRKWDCSNIDNLSLRLVNIW